jgi:hypothetical protein
MAVLMLFNTNEWLGFEQVVAATGLKEDELQKALESLVEAKLIKSEPPPESNSTTTTAPTFTTQHRFVLNLKFTAKRLKLKIATGSAATKGKETKQDSESTHKSIDDDRKIYLQVMSVKPTLLDLFVCVRAGVYQLFISASTGCDCADNEESQASASCKSGARGD